MKQLSEQQTVDRLNSLCKPSGSLGTIETIAANLCRIQQTLRPVTTPRSVSIFAADHGVTVEGVSAWPSKVTAAVVRVMQMQRTASGVFAKSLHCDYEVVDVGLGERGTRNLLREAAMDDDAFSHAWSVGTDRASAACDRGANLLIGGEMGIGNTTSASCLIGLLCDVSPIGIVGTGAGLSEERLPHKQAVVAAAIQRVKRLGVTDARGIACQVGGLEIVALAGFYAEAARRRRVILLDGMIATSAAVLADAIRLGTKDFMIAGHRSTEPGHIAALSHLGLEPILDLGMRLGEASGALACLPMLDLAAAMISEMATLNELDVS
jgi:nicotinate-nucleotide--dimethylbenzimidazole phosphoribosyltransferase